MPQIISDIFSDKKISVYKTLPLSQGELFIGKVLGSVLALIDHLLFLIIALIAYSSNKGFSLKVLLFALINFFNLVFTTYGLVTLLILVLMRFTNVGKHRKLFKTIGYIILFAIVGIFYAYPMLNGNGKSATEGISALASAAKNLEGATNIFFTSKNFGLSVGGNIKNNIIFTLASLALSALLAYVLYRFSDKSFYASLSKEAIKKHRNNEDSKISQQNFKEKSQVYAIFRRDLKTLFSNVVFMASTIPMVIIFGTLGAKTGSTIREDAKGWTFADPDIKFWIFVIGFLLAVLIWSNSGFANTALSREHKSFYLFQTLPIDYKKHYKGRMMAASLISFAFNLVLTVIFTFTVKFGLTNAIILFLGMSLGTLPSNSFALYTASKNIKTNWNKPEEINKGNFKALLYYLLSMLYTGLIIGINILANKFFTKRPFIAWIIVSIVFLLTIIFARKLALSSYKKGFYDVND